MVPKRVLIKISGEAISGENDVFDSDIALKICNNIKNVIDSGILVSVVIGGGNIIRGRDFLNENIISRETADSIGMLATVMNGVLFRDIFKKIGVKSEVVSNLNLPFQIKNSDCFSVEKLISENKLLIFVGGVAYPYFSTDTISVIAALLSKCDIILKATKTKGIYDKDPEIFEDATFIEKLTYEQAIEKNIKIMDQTAFSMAVANKHIPIYVFSIKEENCFINAIDKTIKMSVVE
ncbi:MAG: hypothetical protein LBU35_02410 [Holosporales bacterium]|jgi:uridylate kinase|nr:hypothetical protein [Holosporales bacterium]